MLKVISGLLLVLAVSACSVVAPNYSPAVENVQMLRDSGAKPAKVGSFKADPKAGNDEEISLRGSSMTSPVGGKYSAYVEDAMRSDLRAARLLDEKSALEITGILIQNDVDVSGISEGMAIMEGRVLVKRGDEVRYDRTKSVKIVFESSFAGAIAIPKGIQAYPELVQKFLSAVYSDKEFINSLK